jgi:hypothetical protein
VGDIILEVEGFRSQATAVFGPHMIYAGQPVASEAEARSRIIGIAGTDVLLQAIVTLNNIQALNEQ